MTITGIVTTMIKYSGKIENFNSVQEICQRTGLLPVPVFEQRHFTFIAIEKAENVFLMG